ncbi:MAG: hypothetical protein ACYTKD_02835 [Planctomycetota bacterium]
MAAFFGGAVESAPATTVTLLATSKRVQKLPPSAAVNVDLPDARECELGGPVFYIVNGSGTYALTVRDADGGTLATVSAGDAAAVALAQNDTAAGRWIVRVRS